MKQITTEIISLQKAVYFCFSGKFFSSFFGLGASVKLIAFFNFHSVHFHAKFFWFFLIPPCMNQKLCDDTHSCFYLHRTPKNLPKTPQLAKTF